MRKAFIALALGVMLAIGCAGHATARDEDGEFQVFLTKGKTVGVVSEPDWNFSADTDVTVKFLRTEGPFVCELSVLCDTGDGWTTVYEGDIDLADSVDCTIPAGASIKVTAKSVEGKNGNVTFRVVTP